MSSETARFFKLFGAPALHAGRGKILPQLAAEFLFYGRSSDINPTG